MSNATIGKHGEVSLPGEIRERYGMQPNTPVRILETRSGILIIPLSPAPMSQDLVREIEAWQSVGSQAWDMFAFEEAGP